jgi:hypothetical protein
MQLTAELALTHMPAQLSLSPLSVVFAAALMLLCGAISVQLSLGLQKTIALATLRRVCNKPSDLAKTMALFSMLE